MKRRSPRSDTNTDIITITAPRSKKHGEESKHAGDETASSPPMNPVAANDNRLDDDVEEGEILEEEGSGGVSVRAIELREEKIDSQNLGVHADNSGNALTNSYNANKFDSKVNLPKDPRAEVQDELVYRDKLAVHTNGDMGHEYHTAGKKRHAESGSSKGSHKQKNYRDADTPEGAESKLGDWGNSSSSESGRDKNKTMTGSASHDRDLKHVSKDLEREHSTSYSRSLGGGDRHRSRDACGREVTREKDNWEWRRDQVRERSMDRDQRREKDGERRRDRDLRRDGTGQE
ncbi:hypothetical protein GH714_041066 [Hevea brasiliensis]|uniref:Uncharacterized protein n=1 Tax=Hevea brasiliensis TaxID=3981 RepID=A0A6A6MV65_HEVBR|nr:hypothetical protein GH714_041066 [Hevea brasiliensis]